jgi:hypothetical protein
MFSPMVMDIEERRARNRLYMREYKRRLMREDPERVRRSAREWAAKKRAANPEPARAAVRKYQAANREKVRALSKAWFLAHPEYAMEWRLNHLPAWILKSAKSRAKKFGIPFAITPEDIVIPEICPALGITLNPAARRSQPNALTLDRIVPALGYIPGNVRVVSARANRLKSDATVAELEMLLAYVRRETS